jgi:hypothetical protein
MCRVISSTKRILIVDKQFDDAWQLECYLESLTCMLHVALQLSTVCTYYVSEHCIVLSKCLSDRWQVNPRLTLEQHSILVESVQLASTMSAPRKLSSVITLASCAHCYSEVVWSTTVQCSSCQVKDCSRSVTACKMNYVQFTLDTSTTLCQTAATVLLAQRCQHQQCRHCVLAHSTFKLSKSAWAQCVLLLSDTTANYVIPRCM